MISMMAKGSHFESFYNNILFPNEQRVIEFSRRGKAKAIAKSYNYPSQKLTLVGVTGTNGKTTVVSLLYDLFTSLGFKCGLISTVNYYIGERKLESEGSTPKPERLNSLLAEMVNEGCSFCFMEVISYAMCQGWFKGVTFKVGVFTNLTHDHIGYHRTFKEYARCKKRFFDLLPEGSVAITNIDDPFGLNMVQDTKAKVVTYSCISPADHTCHIYKEDINGMSLSIDENTDPAVVNTKMFARYNAYNILAVYSVAASLGVDVNQICNGIRYMKEPKGRLELIDATHGKTVIIDFAHTPDSLEKTLYALHGIFKGRPIITLFGSVGDHDSCKRAKMGEIAERLSDRLIITSDDTKMEDLNSIMDDIRAGFINPERNKTYIPDRKKAILFALKESPEDSVILLAGKGHETYQIIGTEKIPFDERAIVSEYIKGN